MGSGDATVVERVLVLVFVIVFVIVIVFVSWPGGWMRRLVGMTRISLLAACAMVLAACSSSGASGGGRSTSDPRVRTFMGQVPPSHQQGGELLKNSAVAQPRARFLVFAFPQ